MYNYNVFCNNESCSTFERIYEFSSETEITSFFCGTCTLEITNIERLS